MRGLNELAAAGLVALLVTGAGCEDQSYRPIGIELNVMVRSTDDSRIATAREGLLEFGTRALPQLETALHGAPEQARLRLVATLAAMDHAETIPILRHRAVYDTSPAVRQACESTLKGWAARPGAAGEGPRSALTRVAELRASLASPSPSP